MLYTQGKTDCKPGEVGYNEQRLDVLNRHLQRVIDDAYKLSGPKKKNEFDWLSAALGTIGNGFRVKPDTEWAYRI